MSREEQLVRNIQAHIRGYILRKRLRGALTISNVPRKAVAEDLDRVPEGLVSV